MLTHLNWNVFVDYIHHLIPLLCIVNWNGEYLISVYTINNEHKDENIVTPMITRHSTHRRLSQLPVYRMSVSAARVL
jgi:hypothetical protein